MKKILSILLIIAVLVVAVYYFKFKSNSANFEGLVYDCQTNEPVSGARVSINQGNDLLHFFSDSGRNFEGLTNESGKFSFKYGGGGGNVLANKEGYLTTQGTFLGGRTRIGLLKGVATAKEGLTSTACRRDSECLKTEVVNNVTVVKNVCDMNLPQE